MVTNIDKLLRPASIVTFGGNEAAKVIEQCQRMAYDGEIYPVHPRKDRVGGLPAYRCLADLPLTPDAAFIGVNRHLTIKIVRQLAQAGVGGACCYASGFKEHDAEGARLQQQLLAAAADMPIIGPNSYGLLNYLDGVALWPDQHGGQRLSATQSGVAIVTQSSNIAINITMQQRALPLAYLVTAGNQAQIGLARIAMGLLDDARVTALGLHIEGFDDVALMQQLASKARRLRKPIIVLKVGRSEQAQQTTFSHTASLAGSDTASSAFLRRLGIPRVHSIPQLIETLKLLHVAGPLSGAKISSMSCSGGEASLIADAAMQGPVSFPKLSRHRKQQVQAVLGPRVKVSNPLDYHTYIWADEALMTAAYQAMMGPEFDFNLLLLDFPRADACNDAEWTIAVNAFKAALASRKKQHPATAAAIVSSLPENLTNPHAQRLIDVGITPLCGFDDAIVAIGCAAAIGAAWAAPEAAPLLASRTDAMTPVLASEAQAKQILAEFGVAVARGFVVADAKDAVAKAEQLGYPVVVKVLNVAHKTELNGVRLNLLDAASVRTHSGELLKLGTRLYVEEMIQGSQLELLVGLKFDQQFGFILTLGHGGIWVELLKDTTSLLLPCKAEEIERALMQLRCAPLFGGYRGLAKADLGAVVDNILKLQDYALANKDQLLELEINPLLVCAAGQGAYAVDVLLSTRAPTVGAIDLDSATVS